MRTWPIEIRFKPDQRIDEGDIWIGGDETFHHGMLAAADGHEPYPNGLLSLYMARLAEFSGAFGEQQFGKRLIIDLADARWNALDLEIHGKHQIVSGDDVFRANAERIRAAVWKHKGIDQVLQVWANEIYFAMLSKLRAEDKDTQ